MIRKLALPSSPRFTIFSLCIAGALSGCALVTPTAHEPAARGAQPDGRPTSAAPAKPSASPTEKRESKPSAKAETDEDRTHGKQVGTASFYADKFAGRKMADGTRMDPSDNNAAHKTLPLGSTARVTNLETGRSAVITIQDRGPFVKGRIVDLSPATAREIGLSREDGLAPVEVTPLSIPKR
ncbi:septal ring lytic transglycosylase RlpA family protein [Variovorax defluvii]|uniref:Endolytic peptidoglycan transglycosylase RlpA n=1 Tax=Variovorax defluvii TaxID=913761 RepID=A0ABP8HW23_9BURK